MLSANGENVISLTLPSMSKSPEASGFLRPTSCSLPFDFGLLHATSSAFSGASRPVTPAMPPLAAYSHSVPVGSLTKPGCPSSLGRASAALALSHSLYFLVNSTASYQLTFTTGTASLLSFGMGRSPWGGQVFPSDITASYCAWVTSYFPSQ